MRIDKPKTIIETLKKNNYDVDKTAKMLGIHRVTVYRWIKRSRSTSSLKVLSTRKLHRKSTKPHKINYALTNSQKADILNIRKTYGYDHHKIKKILELDVSSKTIQRYLKRYGLVEPTKKYRRPKFQDTKHMNVKNTKTIGYLQMDVKYVTPELSGLPYTCFEYAVIDIYSRYKEAVILNQLNQDGAILALMEILPKLPFKIIFLQTDNGLEFQTKFVKYLNDLDIKHHFIHKSTPNENAVVERSFRTDQEEFFYRLEERPKDYDHLRELFAQYLHIYNTFRPHHGINLMTPAEVVAYVVSH